MIAIEKMKNFRIGIQLLYHVGLASGYLASVFFAPSFAFAQAGPPLITDDPETPELHGWEINLATTIDTSTAATSVELPLLDANYGFQENVQLKYEVPFVFFTSSGQNTVAGLDNSEIGVKYRFIDKDHGDSPNFLMSTYPQLTFRSPVPDSLINQAIVAGTGVDLYLPIEMEQIFGAFEINEELGIHWIGGGPDQFSYGLAGSYAITEALLVLGEFHGDVLTDFSQDDLVFNLGTQIGLSKKVNLLFSFGHSLLTWSASPPQTLGYFAIQLLL